MSVKSKQAPTPEELMDRQNKAVCRAIFAIQEDLALNTADIVKILGNISKKTLGRWEDEGRIPNLDGFLREAISHFLGIFRSLSAMFSNGKDREAWIKSPHPELEKAPLDIMKGSMEGLIQVRRYLDYVRGRGA